MQLLFNNPFRTLGILVGTSVKEQQSRIRKLKMYLEADQDPDEDFSLPSLGNFKRNSESIDPAAARINLNKDRIQAAIFWFIDAGIADESALDSLKISDLDDAANKWRKLTSSNEVTHRNYSAFQNLSTLLLFCAFKNQSANLEFFKEAVITKLKFLESDSLGNFIAISTDEHYRISKEDVQVLFLNAIQPEAESRSISSQQFLEILTNVDFSAKSIYLKSFAKIPIEVIETFIAEAKQKRKANPSKAAAFGNNLFSQVAVSLNQLKSILGASDIRYSTIADKVAEEILQCGIDYFKHYQESAVDPSKGTMNCLTKAKLIAVGSMTRQRCKENIENLQEWIDDKDNRDRQKVVLQDLEQVSKIINDFEHKPQTIVNAKALLSFTKSALQNIKSALGATDELYLGVSSRIASDAQGMLVEEINGIHNRIEKTFDQIARLALIVTLKSKVEEAWLVTQQIGNMDLRSDFRSNYNSNRQALSELRTDLSRINTDLGSSSRSSSTSSSNRSSGSKGNSGCYIATMAYGSYEHPQVLLLRRFRDEVLAKSKSGRLFIRIYYACSPWLVKVLGKQPAVNVVIRAVLNRIIKMLKT